MKNFLLALISALSIFTLSFAEESSVKVQDTEAAFRYFEAELNFTAGPGTARRVSDGREEGVIVDLRRSEHFAEGHIPGAINLPFDKYDSFDGDQKEFSGLSKDKINYVYCYELLCNLSQRAAKKFAELGYPVKEIRGGYKSYEEHGYPIEK